MTDKNAQETKVLQSEPSLKMAVDLALTKKDVADTKAAFDAHKVNESAVLGEINDKVDNIKDTLNGWPLQLRSCKEEVAEETKKHVSTYYATQTQLTLMEQRLNQQISSLAAEFKNDMRMLTNKFTWTVGGFVAAGVLITWLLEVFKNVQ